MRLLAFIAGGALAGALVIGAETALAQGYATDAPMEKDKITFGKNGYFPDLNRAFPGRVIWGDTHLHTSHSTDAGMIGNFLGPDEAFRFAHGETARISSPPTTSTTSEDDLQNAATLSHHQISPIETGSQPIMTARGRIRGRMPIVLRLSAIGRSHLGNPWQIFPPNLSVLPVATTI